MNNPLIIILTVWILVPLYLEWISIRNVVAYENLNRVLDAVHAYNMNEINRRIHEKEFVSVNDPFFIQYSSVRDINYYSPWNPFHIFGFRKSDFVSADIYAKIKPLLDEMRKAGNEHEH